MSRLRMTKYVLCEDAAYLVIFVKVKEAFLASAQPSELLVRGVVNTELRCLESSLEDKVALGQVKY